MSRIGQTGRRTLTGLLFLALKLGAGAHEFGDDTGDSAATARAVVLGSNYTGVIEIDTDQDWFAVPVQPLREYTVRVVTNTLWHSALLLRAPDGVTALSSTDSVVAVTSRVTWVHFGLPATYYVQAGGFAQFTTGRYTFAASEVVPLDADNDGMPDAWENGNFGSTSQPPSGAAGDWDHDGSDNLHEYWAGTSPTNDGDRLRFTLVSSVGDGAVVAWSSVPLRYYRLDVSTNLGVAGWQPLAVVSNYAGASALGRHDPAATNRVRSFYRVECLH